MICYHFTTKKALSRIRKDGFLKPNTRLFLMKNIDRLHKEFGMSEKNYKLVKKFIQRLPRNKFIVVIPKNRIRDWISSDLMREIRYFIKPDYRLEFEVPKNCKIFVREHINQSPQNIKKKFKKNMYMYVSEPHKTNIWIKYLKSTRKMKNELDLKNFKVPELWLGCTISIAEMKVQKLK